MSSNSLETQDLESNSSGVISKVTTFITSKKGMYLFAIILKILKKKVMNKIKNNNTNHLQAM
jgi:hypothetical protein